MSTVCDEYDPVHTNNIFILYMGLFDRRGDLGYMLHHHCPVNSCMHIEDNKRETEKKTDRWTASCFMLQLIFFCSAMLHELCTPIFLDFFKHCMVESHS